MNDRPERGVVARFWSAIPNWLRILSVIAAGAAAVAGVTRTGRGVYDDQLATPAQVRDLRDWKTAHEVWTEQKYDELRGADAVHEHRLEVVEEDIKRLNCKLIELQRGGSMIAC